MLLPLFNWVSSRFSCDEWPASLRRPLLFAISLSILSVLVASLLALSVSAAPLEDVPQTIVQPDGEELHVFASGDEFYHWLHDQNGYVIVQNAETGFFVYAIEKDGDIVPSQYVAGKVDPSQVGLKPNVMPSPEVYQQRRSALRPAAESLTPVASSNTGTLNNLVVFIRFSDESEFGETLSSYDDMFNDTTAGANSLRNYYSEASYNQLTVSSTLYPTTAGTTVVSYQDTHARNYYRPYNTTTNTDGYSSENMVTREHDLLRSALNSISSQVPAGLNLDHDNDGKVDNVAFIVRGATDGWSDLLWPHAYWLPGSNTVTINSKKVSSYNLELQNQLMAGRGVGILAHEMFHTLGAPDLYHYSYDGLHPAWKWDLMEWDLNPPQHMGAYMKQRYGGWIASIPEITTSGAYSLQPLTSSTNNAYKVASPNSTTEYYVLEYRRKTGAFEASLPGEGLLVYRVNTARDGQGNRDGPPDEVYIYRPNGGRASDGTPADAGFSSGAGRTSFSSSTNPSPFLSDGSQGGLRISGVGAAGDTISFRVDFGTIVTDTNSVIVPEEGTASFSVKLSEQPSGDVVISVSRQSGDSDISVESGASLTFTTANWNAYQTVTLAAARDDDFRSNSATIRVRSTGMPDKDVTAYEIDLYGVGTSWPGASVPFYDGFESGALSSAWKTYTAGYGVIQVTSSYSPHSGSNHVMMKSNSGNALGELILSVDLEGKKNVTLQFWHKETWVTDQSYTDPRPVVPETYAEHDTARGVSVSNDGGTWYRVDSLDGDNGVYTFHSLNLDTITGQVEIPYSSHFLIKFQWFNSDDSRGPASRAMWFDDISVSVGRTLSLMSPTNVGERGMAGTSRNITWTSSGSIGSNVKIELYQAGSIDSTIAYSTPNDGLYTWPIPLLQAHATDYRVKVSAIDDSDVYDFSNNDFEVYGAEITLTSPNGGERWQQYSTHNITWTSVNLSGAIRIDLFKGGALERTIIASALNDGTEIWNIAAGQPAGDDYEVKITAVGQPTVSDWSDDNFSVYAPGLVLKSPNGGEHLVRGSTYTISWDKVGTPGATVKLELYKGGTLSNTIYPWVQNNGSVAWAPLNSQTPGADYRIVITDLSFPDATDQSDADFEIVAGSLKITTPAGGERWQQGAAIDMYWSSTGDPGANVKVEAYKGGVLNTVIIASWSEHVGWARWNVPIGQNPGTDYTIKVTSLSYPTISSTSKPFEIYAGEVHLTAPNGGEGWQAGSSHDITWTSSYAATAAVKLEIYKAGVLDSTIVASTPNTGSYTWPIPFGQTAGTAYRVKLSFTTAPTVTDTSDNDFKITAVAQLALTAPNGAEHWQRGASHSIAWTSAGDPGADVKLELYNSGALDGAIVDSTPNDGNYLWAIPASQAAGAAYRVKVSSVSVPSVSDTSDADFTIIYEVAPVLTAVAPNSGTNDGPTVFTQLTGSGFVSGATVKLVKAGSSDITAGNVAVVGSTQITCQFNFTGTEWGYYDVVVTNADGQSGTLPQGFRIITQPANINEIAPAYGVVNTAVNIVLTGSGFISGSIIKLTKTGQPDIVAAIITFGPTRITGAFGLVGAAIGNWDVTVVNPDNQTASKAGAFTVTMPTTEITIGQGTQSIEYLMGTNFHDRRVQVIYLASEIGQAGAISALALNVATPPGATLNNWTIRMRHFTQSAESGIWIVAGAWDTVYQGNEPPGTSGWLVFNFSQPFEYNGGNNLEIDFSFNNSAIGAASGTCFYSTPGGNRTLFGASNSANGDPLNWTSNVPLPTLSDKVPNIRFIMGSTGGYNLTVNVSPAGSGTVNYNGGTFQAESQLNLVAQANVGWVFDHWSDNATGTNPNINLTMDSNKTVTAYFKAVQNTLTISKTAGGSVTAPGEGTFTHNYGQQVPLVAVPDTGYRFVNWTGDVSTMVNYTAASTTITMNGNATITANFALTVTIPGDVNGDGQVNIVDLTLVAAAFGSTMAYPNWNAAADLNQDGVVNIFDLVIVGLNFGGQTLQGDGSSPDKAGLSVKAIKTTYPGSPSGVYWIDPDGAGGGAPFAVYADMSADGGGWMLILSFQDPGPIWSGYAEGPIGGAANLGYFDGSALGNPSDPSSNYRLPKTAGTFELIGATEMLVTRSDIRSQKFTGLDSTALDGFSTYYDSTNHDGNAIGGDNYWHIGSNNRFGSPHVGLSVGGPGVNAGISPNNDPDTLHYGHFHVAEENIPRWCWGEEVSSTPYRYRYYLR